MGEEGRREATAIGTGLGSLKSESSDSLTASEEPEDCWSSLRTQPLRQDLSGCTIESAVTDNRDGSYTVSNISWDVQTETEQCALSFNFEVKK